ncbi:fungal-specific transcription factor domain-containing protein [Coprinopsis sp. MPI-PUGE-AT-0042]|nr:fungal-specific transcription factor domain-containing protein [Coprinopsis sp. MPI-PUGE-AT-0042]
MVSVRNYHCPFRRAMSTIPNKVKRQRLKGACDICRQRKIKCNSGSMPDNRCTRCLEFGLECTHKLANQKMPFRVPLARNGDPQDKRSWDQRRTEMQPLLDTILSPNYRVPTSPAVVRDMLVSLASYATYLQQKAVASPPALPEADVDRSEIAGPFRQLLEYVEQPDCLPEGALVDDLTERMQSKLNFDTPPQNQFFGFSSASLVRTALEHARDSEEQNPTPPRSTKGPSFKRHQFWTIQPASSLYLLDLLKWDKGLANSQVPYVFPEADLLDHLVDCYFENSDPFKPVLHQPSFERSLEEGLHIKDRRFGGCVLAVCAVGARHSKDKRVIPEGVDSGLELGAGTQWFRQLGSDKQVISSTPSLHELQTYLLSIIYLHGTSDIEKGWYLIGATIRAAQDAGIHRRSRTAGPPTVEKELLKRVWWGLVLADATSSIASGHPRAIHPSDYDAELPIECDSEYWENPNPALAFKQPPGKPSKVTSMIKLIELLTILGSAHIAFYSINRPSLGLDVEAQTLADHDSALNAWVDSVPDHRECHRSFRAIISTYIPHFQVRWDPDRINNPFFDQSAYLLVTYYWVQMVVHIPFIERKDSLARSSFAICANAARACSRLMEHCPPRSWMAMPHIQVAIFKSALILLMGVWKGKSIKLSFNQRRELEGVYRCARVMAIYEIRWVAAGRCIISRDIIRALAGASNVPFPEPLLQPSSPSDPSSTGALGSSSSRELSESLIASSHPSPISPDGYQTPGLGLDYPMYTNELSQPSFLSDNAQNPYYDDFDAAFLASSFAPVFLPPSANHDLNSIGSHERRETFFEASREGSAHPPVMLANEPATLQPSFALDNPSMWAGVPPEFHWTAWSAYLSTPIDSQQRAF